MHLVSYEFIDYYFHTSNKLWYIIKGTKASTPWEAWTQTAEGIHGDVMSSFEPRKEY